MKRIEIMAKMDEMDVAQEIVEFLIEHKFYYKECEWYDGHRLDSVYGLAQYLGEEVGEVAE